MTKKNSFREDLKTTENTAAELFHWSKMLHVKRVLSDEQVTKFVAYLKGTRNTFENACKLVGVQEDDIDDASMIEIETRVAMCKSCFMWFDLSVLNEKDECPDCKNDPAHPNYFRDDYDGEMV